MNSRKRTHSRRHNVVVRRAMWLVMLTPMLVGADSCWQKVDNTPVCVPDATAEEDCYCRNGDPGRETCKSDGLGYGPCICDAGTDAALDAGDVGDANDDASGDRSDGSAELDTSNVDAD
jgi:hypothetical protein